jgi:fatty acid amide hydrolase
MNSSGSRDLSLAVRASPRLWELPAHELSRLIAKREISAVEAVREHIARIEQVNVELNAVVCKRYDAALKEATEADSRLARGEVPKALHGVPVSIKESLDLAGTASTVGLASRKDTLADATDLHVARLREAGAIVLCKTNVAQMLVYMESDNPLHGRSNNPWNLARTPGGSSGGEAAIVAAGGAALGLGTDIGGSIRCPASFCGIYGLKPTTGRCTDVGRYSIPVGQRAITSQVGPFGRTVEDVATVLEIINGGALPECTQARPLLDHRSVEFDKLRIAWFVDDGDFPASPAARRAVREAADILTTAGARVTPWQPPDIRSAVKIFYGLLAADGMRSMRKMARGNRLDPRVMRLMVSTAIPRPGVAVLRALLPLVGQRRLADLLDAFGFVGTHHYWRFVDEQSRYQQQFAQAVDRRDTGGPFDAILCPSFAVPALTHGASADIGLGGAYVLLANLLGWPAGSAPFTRVRADEETDRKPSADLIERAARKSELGSQGLPIGVQVIARPWCEHIVLGVMRVLEEAQSSAPDYPCRPGLVMSQAATPQQ